MMTTPATDNPTVRAHAEAFAGLASSLPGDGAARRAALARFEAAGLPTRRVEEWKFTGLDALSRKVFAPATPATPAGLSRAQVEAIAGVPGAIHMVFINGTFDASLSDALPAGVALLSGASLPSSATGEGRGQSLVALNAAFMRDGAVIDVADNVRIAQPLALVFFAAGDGAAVHTRNLIRLGAGAAASVVEIHASLNGADATFSNTVTEADIGAGARLTHGRIAAEGKAALHHSHAAASIGKGGEYVSFALSVGGELTRQESDVRFGAPGGTARLYGAYLGRGRQHMDHTTRVRHDHPGCATEELFKGALDGEAHGVFQGLIHVAPHAVKTDARQRNVNLLLSDRAVADAKPELEILADDVKCSHGATVGDLDADEIFYLRARGLSPDAARRLLLAGYVEDLIGRLDDDAIAAAIKARTDAWLGEEQP
jgi:Fe-S cluster assembly protein SufD